MSDEVPEVPEYVRRILRDRLDDLDSAVKRYLQADTELDLRRAERDLLVTATKVSGARSAIGREVLA